MNELTDAAIDHIAQTAGVPSFSSYEERLHPYVNGVLEVLPGSRQLSCPGNNLIWFVPGTSEGETTIALAAHLDKIDHYGPDYRDPLPVQVAEDYIEGAMDNSAGLGIILALAGLSRQIERPDMLLFFSEMEESKGLKEHPERLKDHGHGYNSGMGARRIARQCLANNWIPDEVITVDTTPLFKGDPGVALYARHWELNDLENPSQVLLSKTKSVVQTFRQIDDGIKLANNTNDYLHYGELFNQSATPAIPSVALEPSIYPYHQPGERVFRKDIRRVLHILTTYLQQKA